MTEATVLPLADTSDMVEVHRVFRHALDDAPKLVGSVRPHNVARAELIGSYYHNVLRLLHAHHDGEDRLLTPRLIERNPHQVAVITYVAAQHKDVLLALQQAEASITAWYTNPEPAVRAKLLDSLRHLKLKLSPHLDLEESAILPLAAGCITVAEWGELPSHGLAAFDGDKPWLVIGLIRSHLSPAHRADMDAHLPPPVAAMWADTGQGSFDRFISALGA